MLEFASAEIRALGGGVTHLRKIGVLFCIAGAGLAILHLCILTEIYIVITETGFGYAPVLYLPMKHVTHSPEASIRKQLSSRCRLLGLGVVHVVWYLYGRKVAA